MTKDLQFEIDKEGPNEVIDENGNMVMMLRRVAWNGKEARLELRKWIIDTNDEKPMRGVTFMTEQGPHNAAEALVGLGYGRTNQLLNTLKTREDFEESLVSVIGKKKVEKAKSSTYVESEDYFIPNKENLGI